MDLEKMLDNLTIQGAEKEKESYKPCFLETLDSSCQISFSFCSQRYFCLTQRTAAN